MTRADVVIPTFNDHGTLRRAVSSALAAEFVDRVIVVDDGSERPPQLDENQRLSVVRQDNAGPSAARNTGLEASRAAWVIMLDADDELLAGAGQALQDAAAAGAVAAVGAKLEIRPEGELHKPPPAEWADRALPNPGDVFKPIQLFGATGAMVARRAIDAGVRFPVDIKVGEDRAFLREAANVGPIWVSSQTTVNYHVDPAADNLSGASTVDRRAADFRLLVERYLDEHSRPHFRDQAVWLANYMSKHGRSTETWRAHAELCRAHGWPVPLKSRLRRLLRSRAS